MELLNFYSKLLKAIENLGFAPTNIAYLSLEREHIEWQTDGKSDPERRRDRRAIQKLFRRQD